MSVSICLMECYCVPVYMYIVLVRIPYTFVHVCKCTFSVSVSFPPPANAVMLLVVALLYFYRVQEHEHLHSSLYPVYFLYVIVGLELLFALPCLIYYIGEPCSRVMQSLPQTMHSVSVKVTLYTVHVPAWTVYSIHHDAVYKELIL